MVLFIQGDKHVHVLEGVWLNSHAKILVALVDMLSMARVNDKTNYVRAKIERLMTSWCRFPWLTGRLLVARTMLKAYASPSAACM